MRTLTPTPAIIRPPAERAPALRPVRVCFLIDELAVAGTETQLLALIQHLDRSRIIPHLGLLRGESEMSRALEPADCPVWRLGVGSLARPTTVAKLLRFARLLRTHRIDVLQAYFPDSSYFGLPAAWLAGVPNRLRTRNNLGHWLTPLHRRLGRALNVLTTGTLTNCEAAREALLAAEGPAPTSVHVLENGVDLGRFLSLPAIATTATDSGCVGAVANLRAVKGVDVFVAAAGLLADRYPGVVFQVAGEGEQRSELEAAIARLGLSERLLLPGGSDNVPAFLAGLDVAVLPSRAEGMSNALLEYMAAGRAIVATAVGGNSELVEQGVHALLVPPDDPASLARAIARLLDDRALARRLGANARQRAREGYGREAMVRRFEDFYDGLERRRPREFADGRA
jgi:glycosyltransferase involved in cell wall biosynthesis